jgi:transcriptional regulator with XRE-family HTH domain
VNNVQHDDPPRDVVPFGRTLSRLREQKGLTQLELAVRAGMSRGYVAQLESGYRGDRVRRATVEALAAALEVSPASLLQAAQLRVRGQDITPSDRIDFVTFVETEPTLSAAQRRMIVAIYREMQRSED